MSYGPFENAREEREITPFDPAFDHSATLSRRAYNLIMGGMVLLGFVVIALCASIAGTYDFQVMLSQHYQAIMIASIAVPIAGIVALVAGMRGKGLALPLLGYALIVGSIGFTTGIILPFYSLPSIMNAFVGTILIAALFTLLGVSFPSFFARIQGALIAVLLGLILVSIAGRFMGVAMSWLDYIILVVFSGFIAYDTYQSQQCEPTVKMAVLFAVNIWLDLVNIFLSLLSILGNRE